jgi:hypothetical protein
VTRPPAETATVKVVGTSFSTTPELMYRLEDRKARLYLFGEGGTIPASLRRDPTNEHDTNAICVDVDEVGQVGHLPALLAARVAPEMDAGVVWTAELTDVLVHPDHPLNPGLTVRIARAAA